MKKQNETITVVIPTFNEEKNIVRAIKSVLWCDKILVLDANSTDRTREVAKNLGALVQDQEPGRSFEAVQKSINCANRNCKTDWVLRMDADEEVTPQLREEILAILKNGSRSEYVAYGIPRRQFFLGGFLKGGDWAYDRLIRLYRPEFVSYSKIVSVHEQFEVRGLRSNLKFALNHYSHPTTSELLKKWNSYTDLEAKDLKISKVSALFNFFFQPPYVFLRWLIWHKGWKDGFRGILAGLFRGYYEILKYGKYILR